MNNKSKHVKTYVNYPNNGLPYLQITTLLLKLDTRLNEQLRMFQILTKNCEKIFAKIYCFDYDASSVQILHEPIIADLQTSVEGLKAKNQNPNNKKNSGQLQEQLKSIEKLQDEINILKNKAIVALDTQGMGVPAKDLICCYTINPKYSQDSPAQSKYIIKIRLGSYDLNTPPAESANSNQEAISAEQQSKEVLQAKVLSVDQKQFPRLFSWLQGKYEEVIEEDSTTDFKKLLRIEEAYHTNVFQETDQIIQERQFRGEAKWLNEFFVVLNLSLQKIYTCVDCVDHFSTFTAQETKQVREAKQANNTKYCTICKAPLVNLVSDKVLTFLNKNVYNPKRKTIVYFPRYNRFKIIQEAKFTTMFHEGLPMEPNVQHEETIHKFVYENYYHFRDTIKKISGAATARPLMVPIQTSESFDITFLISDKKVMIRDPCRGRFCRHLAFFDLRQLYNTEKNGKYNCKICKEPIQEKDILYLHETVILLKLAEQAFRKKQEKSNAPSFNMSTLQNLLKLSGQPQHAGVYVREYRFLYNSQSAKLEINHSGPKKTVKLRYKAHVVQDESISVDRIYNTLMDPLWYFDESELGVEDEEMERMMHNYNWAQQN